MSRNETSSPRARHSSSGARTIAATRLTAYCKDLDRWPQSWAGFPELDVPVGDRILEEFKRFLLQLIQQDRARKTVTKYADYLWVLGGELIRHVNDEEKDRALPARELILDHIDDTGGPPWRHAQNERDRHAFDSVCRRLYRFMTGTNG